MSNLKSVYISGSIVIYLVGIGSLDGISTFPIESLNLATMTLLPKLSLSPSYLSADIFEETHT